MLFPLNNKALSSPGIRRTIRVYPHPHLHLFVRNASTWRDASGCASCSRPVRGTPSVHSAVPTVGKRSIRSVVGGPDAGNTCRLAVLNCNRLWSLSGRLHDAFHGFVSFLDSLNCVAALLQETCTPVDAILPDDQPFFFEGMAGTRGRDVGYLQRAEPLKHLHVIPSVPDQSDIAWRFLHCQEGSWSVAVASFYAPHVGCPDIDRLQFWQRLYVSIQMVTHEFPEVPLLIAGDSNVWFPGLVNGRPPRPADRLCVEFIRSILHTFGMVICNPVDVPTHRRGAALDLVIAGPDLVQSVEVHDGASCHCVDRRRCCPQVGSDHFALTATLRCNVKSTVSPLRRTLQVRSWPELLQSQYHKIQHWVQLVNESGQAVSRADARQQLDSLYASLLDILWNGEANLYKQRTDAPQAAAAGLVGRCVHGQTFGSQCSMARAQA